MRTEFRVAAPARLVREAISDLDAAQDGVVFFLAESSLADASIRLMERVVLDPIHVEPWGFHGELSDAGRQLVLRRATDSGMALVELHSHGPLGDPARFSFTDHRGLAAWVPHVQWRVPGQPYGALVVGDATIDGLLWPHDGVQPLPVSDVEFDGGTTWKATGLSYDHLVRLA